MSICNLTKKAKAQRLQANFQRLFIGYKQESGLRWEDLGEVCDESRQTLQNRFNGNMLDLWEWAVLMDAVGMPMEELTEVMKL